MATTATRKRRSMSSKRATPLTAARITAPRFGQRLWSAGSLPPALSAIACIDALRHPLSRPSSALPQGCGRCDPEALPRRRRGRSGSSSSEPFPDQASTSRPSASTPQHWAPDPSRPGRQRRASPPRVGLRLRSSKWGKTLGTTARVHGASPTANATSSHPVP